MKKNLILLLLFASIVPAVIIQWVLIFPNTRETISNQARLIHHTVIREEGSTIKNLLDAFASKAKLAALYPPIQGIIRARETGIDPVDQSTLKQWKERLQTIFFAEIQTDPDIFQMRYLDEKGQEMIRVEKIGETVRIAAESELQNKSDRYYFRDIMRASKNSVYVSPLDLNVENEVIQIPYVPVLRFGIPVFDAETGQRKGAVIMNIFAERILRKVTQVNGALETILIDRQGQFLIHPDMNKLFSDQLGTHTYNYFLEQPELIDDVARHNIFDSYDSEEKKWRIWQKIFYNPQNRNEYWILFKVIDEDDLLQPLWDLRQRSFFITILFIPLTIIVTFFAGKSIARPLEKITRLARSISKGNRNAEFPSDLLEKKDEIGQLARAFFSMTQTLNQIYNNLEKGIFEKTKDLQKQNADLEDTQKALANVLEDITEEKEKMQQQIRETKKFQQAVERSTDGIIITNPAGFIIYVNKAWEAMNGYLMRDVVGKKPALLRSGKTNPEVYTKMWKSIEKGQVFQTEDIINKRKDGSEYPVQLSVIPIQENKKNIFYLGIQQDITKRKEIDKAKTEFVSLASHQLRTPLSAINWFSAMLLDGDAGKISKEQKKYVQQIYDGNKRMVKLVDSLLNVSRIELGTLAIDPEDVDLKETAKSVLSELAPDIKEKNLKIITQYDEKLPVLSADPKLIRIIFQNLLSNAVKYTPEKGKIELSVQKKRSDISIQVTDTGYGIPKGQADKIFTKLFRADNVKQQDTEGNGLGLYLVKSIVEQAGGEIRFTSQENKGTTFFVTLPQKGMKSKKGIKKLNEKE